MPSAAKTKSGRIFRAPTDQARKLERRRENKKNKKDRQQIRQTIAKCLNVDELTSKMLAIERQILGLDEPMFHMDVLKKKQKTVMDMLDKRRTVLQTLKDDEELTQLNEKLQHYYQDAKKLRSLAEQERLARTADVNIIPLPEGDLAQGERRTIQLMGPIPTIAHKKKVEFRLPRAARGKLRPPGPPCGLPPSLSDSEGEEDYQLQVPDEDDLAPIPIPDFDNDPRPPRFKNYAPVMPIRKVPGPPPMPPAPPMFNPMGIPMPPAPRHDGGAVISSAPVIRRDVPPAEPKAPAPTVVSAEPQLRDLRKETVKLVPAVLKRARPANQPKRSRPAVRPVTADTQTAKTTDDAYNDFMKELGDLI